MIPVMKTITDDEIRAAAEYYAALKPVADWTDVVEAEMVPKTRVSPTYMRFAIENAGEEPLGNRIIELPKAPERAELRDSRFGFIAHVPRGSIARGKALVTSGEKTAPCSFLPRQRPEGQRRHSAPDRPLAELSVPATERHQDRGTHRSAC